MQALPNKDYETRRQFSRSNRKKTISIKTALAQVTYQSLPRFVPGKNTASNVYISYDSLIKLNLMRGKYNLAGINLIRYVLLFPKSWRVMAKVFVSWLVCVYIYKSFKKEMKFIRIHRTFYSGG